MISALVLALCVFLFLMAVWLLRQALVEISRPHQVQDFPSAVLHILLGIVSWVLGMAMLAIFVGRMLL